MAWCDVVEPRTLRECRIALDQSQSAFAGMLGVSPESYRTWDAGRRATPLKILARARALATHRDEQALLPLPVLAQLIGVHVKTLRSAARDGRLLVTYDTQTTFRQLRARATLAAVTQFRHAYYGRRNDKGKVEGLVGYARRNFFVPIPRFASWDALNAALAHQCGERRGRRLRRHTETIGERFARDRAALLPLPPVPYDACDTRTTRVTSLSLVRYRRNDYSVPTAYGHREVLVKGSVDEVVIVCGSAEIARHRRSYDREVLIFEPRHYLALLERKTGALDQAAPLAAWQLPDEFLRLRRLLEARLGKPGTREYIQVLRLLEDFQLAYVRGAVQDAVRLGAIGFDAVKHLVVCRLDHRPARLDLAQYPHLPAAHVATTAATDYLALLGAE